MRDGDLHHEVSVLLLETHKNALFPLLLLASKGDPIGFLAK